MEGGARKGSNWCGGGRGVGAGCWCNSARVNRTTANIHHWCSWRWTKCHTSANVGVWVGTAQHLPLALCSIPTLPIDTLVWLRPLYHVYPQVYERKAS